MITYKDKSFIDRKVAEKILGLSKEDNSAEFLKGYIKGINDILECLPDIKEIKETSIRSHNQN